MKSTRAIYHFFSHFGAVFQKNGTNLERSAGVVRGSLVRGFV